MGKHNKVYTIYKLEELLNKLGIIPYESIHTFAYTDSYLNRIENILTEKKCTIK